MGDVVTPEVRSRMKAGIQGKNTKPEMELRRLLHRQGFRYRLHDKRLPGRPDLVFPRWAATVQVHGCFWHAHQGCRYFKLPSTRPEFWADKLEANRLRDQQSNDKLRAAGWRVAVVWECVLRSDPIDTCLQVADWLKSGSGSLEVPEEKVEEQP